MLSVITQHIALIVHLVILPTLQQDNVTKIHAEIKTASFVQRRKLIALYVFQAIKIIQATVYLFVEISSNRLKKDVMTIIHNQEMDVLHYVLWKKISLVSLTKKIHQVQYATILAISP